MFALLNRIDNPRLVAFAMSTSAFVALYLPDLASAGRWTP